jgi:asparagine synthase (glutamine-hydrolysing)
LLTMEDESNFPLLTELSHLRAPGNNREFDHIEFKDKSISQVFSDLRTVFEKAVEKRIPEEVPYGILLSGGLDSSLVASIVVRHVRKNHKISQTQSQNGSAMKEAARRVRTFSIGLAGAPDLIHAKRVAEFLGTAHTECIFTVQEGIDALSRIIWHLETYDVTTVRASTPMFLLSRRVRAEGLKVVLSGEGSDEALGGYLYFFQAPTDSAFQNECVSRVRDLHASDCLRANKSTMAWGIEARVPFLDSKMLNYVMQIPGSLKRCKRNIKDQNDRIEKWVLRAAFSPENTDDNSVYLPDNVLWRQKEQFSDGVGYSWIDSLKSLAEEAVDDASWDARAVRFPQNTPETHEAYLYRAIFESHFQDTACLESVVAWKPRTDWGCDSDPSGRAQRAHDKTTTRK